MLWGPQTVKLGETEFEGFGKGRAELAVKKRSVARVASVSTALGAGAVVMVDSSQVLTLER